MKTKTILKVVRHTCAKDKCLKFKVCVLSEYLPDYKAKGKKSYKPSLSSSTTLEDIGELTVEVYCKPKD